MSDKHWDEARITINGRELTVAQSMTVRVAIESFAAQLQSDGLGQDDTGKAICIGYLNRITELRVALYAEMAVR